jgi:hypothetical protein
MKNRSTKKSIGEFKYAKKKKCFINTCAYCAEQTIEENSELLPIMHIKKAKRLDENIEKRKTIDFNGLVDLTASYIASEKQDD